MFDHIGLRVKDVEASARLYAAMLAPLGYVDRAAVDRFHVAGLKAGAKDNGAPGLRTDYAPTYYAAFLIDFDGNNVEAVCMR